VAKVRRNPKKLDTLAQAKAEPTPSNWRDEALAYLQAFQARHLQAFCSLPDLYANVVKRHGVSIGQFHNGIRVLVRAGEIRLHPFSGSRSALEREDYALVAGQEIMYYVERLESK
jgi:hypothetical protein